MRGSKRLAWLAVTFILVIVHGCDKTEPGPDLEGPYSLGCPEAIYPGWKSSDYVLPYPVGETYKVNLNNCSRSFHAEGQPDEFATDFEMDVGDLITAARGGKVVWVEESGIDGGFPNNEVVVDHGDNTFAGYAHLTHEGALVDVGDTVEQGDPIGYSGNTGLAGYPHLHFVVVSDWTVWPYASLPITFSNTLSNERGLASGTRYPALEY